MEAFDIDDIKSIPGIKSGFGLDFGFIDPNAFICSLIDNKEMIIYIFDEWYKKGATNKIIAEAIKIKGYGGQIIICDAAEPKSIVELQDEGIRAEASRKGRDSVNYFPESRSDLEPMMKHAMKLYRYRMDAVARQHGFFFG